MQTAFIDEAGTDPKEPITVVAAVIVTEALVADIELRMNTIFAEHLATNYSDRFVFHAKDVFSGKGKSIKSLSPAERVSLFKSILEIPSEFRLPIIFCANKQHPPNEDWIPKNEIFMRHVIAFVECLKAINKYMNLYCPSDTIKIVAEQHRLKWYLKDALRILREPNTSESFRGEFEFSKVHQEIEFARKGHERVVELADACAFSIRRFLSKHTKGDLLISWLLNGLDHSFLEMDFEAARSTTIVFPKNTLHLSYNASLLELTGLK